MLASARQGSAQAVGEALETCRSYLLLVANREMNKSLRAKVGASDIVQETLIQAQSIFDRFDGATDRELRRWLGAILKNKLLQVHRTYLGTTKRQLRQEVPMELGENDSRADWLAAPMPSPSEIAQLTEDEHALHRALAKLSKEHRLVIVLRSLERKSFAETGAVLGRSAEAARKLWMRAIQQLQTRLE